MKTLQRCFVKDLHAIFKLDEMTARQVVSHHERSVPAAVDVLISASEALQLGNFPTVAAALVEAVKATPSFRVVG